MVLGLDFQQLMDKGQANTLSSALAPLRETPIPRTLHSRRHGKRESARGTPSGSMGPCLK